MWFIEYEVTIIYEVIEISWSGSVESGRLSPGPGADNEANESGRLSPGPPPARTRTRTSTCPRPCWTRPSTTRRQTPTFDAFSLWMCFRRFMPFDALFFDAFHFDALFIRRFLHSTLLFSTLIFRRFLLSTLLFRRFVATSSWAVGKHTPNTLQICILCITKDKQSTLILKTLYKASSTR